MNPVTNRFSRTRNIEDKKKTFSWRMKTLTRELNTFSRIILSILGNLPAFGVLGKNYCFTVKVNKSLNISKDVEC